MSNMPHVYMNTDPGAPQLTGQPGSFVAVMDAVLVDGYGTGIAAKPPLGWIRAFSGTNRRAYRNAPASYSGNFVRFDDSNATFVLVDGYEVMSSIDSGTERFNVAPTAWGKSITSSAAARDWIIVGTAGIFYVFIKSNGSLWVGFFCGDLHTLGPHDIWRFGYTSSGVSTGYSSTSRLFVSQNVVMGNMSRSSSGVPGQSSIFNSPTLFSGSTNPGASGLPYPLPTTGGMLLSRLVIREGSNASSSPPRAIYPGVWVPEHAGMEPGQIYSGITGIPEGSQLLCVQHNSQGKVLFDVSNEW